MTATYARGEEIGMASLSPARPFAERETLSMLAGRKRQLLAALDEVLVGRDWDRECVACFPIAQPFHALLIHAFEKVPFYQAKYTAAGFDPAEFQSLDDLGKIRASPKRNCETPVSRR